MENGRRGELEVQSAAAKNLKLETSIRDGEPVGVLACGLLVSKEKSLASVKATLAEVWGSIAKESEVIPFDFSRYYEREMGPGLLRQFLAFEKPVLQEALPEFKRQAIALEAEAGDLTSGRLCRRVNSDPGYVTLERLVLATTKNYSHRLYLRDGIYAEVTLIFRSGTFHPLEWTYPDYRAPMAIEFFNQVREGFRQGGGSAENRG
jgi:hypothetical protein